MNEEKEFAFDAVIKQVQEVTRQKRLKKIIGDLEARLVGRQA